MISILMDLVMKAISNNQRTHILGLTDEQRETLDTELSFALPGAYFMPKTKWWQDGRKHFLYRDGLSTGLFLAVKQRLQKKFGFWFDVTTDYTAVERTKDQTRSDRPYQNQCVEAMLSTPVGGLVLGATGSGKTYIVGLYLKKVTEQAVFIIDELTLLFQARKEIQRVLGEPVGIIGKGKWEPERVTVATIQTLHLHRSTPRYRAWAKGIGVVIIDEIHLAINRRNFVVVKYLRPKVCFGLTATLQLQKKEVRFRAYEVCGPTLFKYPLHQGVAEGYLSHGLVVMADCYHDGVPSYWRGLEGYQEAYTSIITEHHERNHRIVNIVEAAYNAGHHVVLLCDRVPHIRELGRLLAGIPHCLVYGAVPVEERQAACRDFDEGKLRLIIANRVFKKGIDIKAITFIIECSGSKDPNDCIQKYGRGVRMSPGKDGLVYVDIRDRQTSEGKSLGYAHVFSDAAAERVKAFRKAGILLVAGRSGLSAERLVRLAVGKLNSTKSTKVK